MTAATAKPKGEAAERRGMAAGRRAAGSAGARSPVSARVCCRGLATHFCGSFFKRPHLANKEVAMHD